MFPSPGAKVITFSTFLVVSGSCNRVSMTPEILSSTSHHALSRLSWHSVTNCSVYLSYLWVASEIVISGTGSAECISASPLLMSVNYSDEFFPFLTLICKSYITSSIGIIEPIFLNFYELILKQFTCLKKVFCCF